MKRIIITVAAITAAIVAQAQNVGINTTTPEASLDVKGGLRVGDSSVLFTANIDLSNPGNPPVSGMGGRMMWYSGKGAFRAGYTPGPHWDKDSTGFFSSALGHSNVASGDYSFATGFQTRASGIGSTTMGLFTRADVAFSTAMGYQSTASGNSSTAMGFAANASGAGATAMGIYTTAKAFGGISLGISNDNADAPDPQVPAASDRLFQLGNGDDFSGIKSNAITVLRNGNTGIGTLTPSEKLDVTGNINLTGQLKFNNNAGSADQVLTSNGAAVPVWKNTNKYVFVQNTSGLALNGGFQSVPTVEGQTFTLTFPAIVKITVNASAQVEVGETFPQEPRFFFRVRQGSTIVSGTTEGYCYIRPQPATFVSNTMTVSQYAPLPAGTYNLECKATTLSAGGSCSLAFVQAMIEIIPQ